MTDSAWEFDTEMKEASESSISLMMCELPDTGLTLEGVREDSKASETVFYDYLLVFVLILSRVARRLHMYSDDEKIVIDSDNEKIVIHEHLVRLHGYSDNEKRNDLFIAALFAADFVANAFVFFFSFVLLCVYLKSCVLRRLLVFPDSEKASLQRRVLRRLLVSSDNEKALLQSSMDFLAAQS